jgi:O-antigen/teichoic acid export membrane protein/2-polyprenyl-3-methyl-5-hydroxy-6-metoxy-1,4-benzoquinol methylase
MGAAPPPHAPLPLSGATNGPESPRLIVDALVNYSGMGVSAVVGILLVPLMLARLGPERYGVWLAAIAVAAVLRSIDFGLGMVVVREVAAASGTRLHRRIEPLVGAAGGALLLLGALGALVIAAGAIVLTSPLRLPEDVQTMVLPVFALVGVAFVAEQGIAFVGSVLNGLRWFGTLNAVGIALVLSRAIGIVVLLLLGRSLVAVAVWYAMATLLTAALAFLVLRSAPVRSWPRLPGRHWRALRRHLRFGLASFAAASAAGLSWQALPLLTAVLLGAGAVVPLHVGQKIPLALTGIYARLAAVIFPAASEYERTNNIQGTRAVLETGSRLVLHLMMPVLAVGVLAAPDILRLWIGEVDPRVVLIFRLTLAAVLADAIGSVASSILWGRGRVAPVLVTALASAGAVVGGALLLLPRFGQEGGAAVLAAVLGAASVTFWVLASRAAGVPPMAFARGAARGIALPTLACAGAAAAVLAVPGVPGLARLALIGVAGTAAYLWTLTRLGATAAEAALTARVLRLPGELALPAARAIGGRAPAIRSLGYLLLAVRAVLRHPSGGLAAEFDRTFSAARDPWGYDAHAQRERIDAAMRAVDRIAAMAPGGVLANVLEIGCAEGTVTTLLAPRCRRLVAADLSAIALERCRERCTAHTGIEYRQTDFAGAEAWGPYDLVVAMDVLECIRSPLALRRARDQAVAMLVPGGHLVVTTTRQHPVPEGAWWGRWLPVGARIHEFVARHPALRVVYDVSTPTHVVTLYRRES